MRYACCGKCFEKPSDEAFLGSSASDEPEIIMDGVADSSPADEEGEEEEAEGGTAKRSAAAAAAFSRSPSSHDDAQAEREDAPLLGKK